MEKVNYNSGAKTGGFDLRNVLLSLARGVSLLLVVEVLVKMASILYFSLVGNTWGAVGVAVVTLADQFSMVTRSLGDLGSKVLATREIAKKQFGTGEIFEAALRLRMVAYLPATLLVFISAVFVYDGEVLYALVLAIPTAICGIAFCDFLPLGNRHVKLLAVGRLLLAMLPVVFLYGFIGLDLSQFWLVPTKNAVFLLVGIVFMLPYWSSIKTINMAPPRRQCGDLTWSNTVSLGFAAATNQIFLVAPTFLLGVISDLKTTGLFAACYRVISVFYQAFNLVTQLLAPIFASADAQDISKRSFYLMSIVILCGGMGLAGVVSWWGGEVVVLVFGDDFSHVERIMKLFPWIIPLEFLSSFLGSFIVGRGSYHTLKVFFVLSLFLLLGMAFFLPIDDVIERMFFSIAAAYIFLCLSMLQFVNTRLNWRS